MGFEKVGIRLQQGPTNTRPGCLGQVEKYAGQVFYFQKKPLGLSIWLMDHVAQQIAEVNFKENFLLYMA